MEGIRRKTSYFVFLVEWELLFSRRRVVQESLLLFHHNLGGLGPVPI